MDYSDRRLTGVRFNTLERARGLDGPGLYASLDIQFSGIDGSDDGPTVTVFMRVSSESENPTFEEAEQCVLDAAAGFLVRAGRETPETLWTHLQSQRADDLQRMRDDQNEC